MMTTPGANDTSPDTLFRYIHGLYVTIIGNMENSSVPFDAHILLCTPYKCVFSALRHFFLFRPRVFSRALGSGARSEPARAPRRKCGPWPRSVAHTLGVRSRENWQVTTGRHSEHVEPSRRILRPNNSCSRKQKTNRLSLCGVETHTMLWFLSFCSTDAEKTRFSHIALHRCRKSSPHRT